MKKNTNERLKLMQKHIALRLLWQVLLDAQKLFLLMGRAGLVMLEGEARGWAGVRALGVDHTRSGPAGNPKCPVWLPGEITRALLKATVMLSYSNAGAPSTPAENRKPRTMLSLSPKPSSAGGTNGGCALLQQGN